MLYRRKLDRVLILVVPALLFLYASTRPHVRLRASMPSQFVDVPASAGPKQREAEEQLALDYWNLVLTDIQWKYTYGSPLPDAPPEGFRLTKQLAPGSELVSSSRLRYWHRLQKVWLQPTSWVTSREWSTDWLTGPIVGGWSWIDNYLNDLIHRT